MFSDSLPITHFNSHPLPNSDSISGIINHSAIVLFHSIYKKLVNFQKWSTIPNHLSLPPHARIRGPISIQTILTF
jgi:hypothetical protein